MNAHQQSGDTQTPTRMAIIAYDYPRTELDKEVTGKIKQHLWVKLDKEPIKTVSWVGLRDGFILIDCSGQDAIKFLEGINGETIGEVKVKVVHEKNIPRAVLMVWKRIKINEEVSFTDELNKLQKLHPKLITCHWLIENSKLMGSQTWSEIWVDQESADVIRDAGYKLHAGLEPSYFEVYTPKKKVAIRGESGVAISGGSGVTISGGSGVWTVDNNNMLHHLNISNNSGQTFEKTLYAAIIIPHGDKKYHFI